MTRILVTPTIDPCFLLPEEESDTGLDLSGAVPLDNTDEAIETPTNVQSEAIVQPETTPEKTITLDAELINELLDAIKTLSERVAQLEKNQQQPIAAPAPMPTAEPTPEPEPEPKPDTAKTTLPKLRYPSLFTVPQCQQAASILQSAHDADKAQLLLDMLDKRLKQQHDPLRSPMRYLETLVKKLNNNRLTINTSSATGHAPPTKTFVSTTTSITGAPTPEPSEEEKIKAEYQEAVLDCRQMERNVNILVERDNISFEESLQKLGLAPWWEQAKERFYAAKEAFISLSGEQVVTA